MNQKQENKMAIDYKVLGKRIKNQRLSKGITQENFAEQLNVSVGYISQLERGITKISLERLVEISEYLSCNVEWLLDGVNTASKQYLSKDFHEMYEQLSAKEKKLFSLFLKTYIDNR